MSIICQNENEKGSSRGADSIGVVIYIGRISRCLEREHIEGFESRTIGIRDNGGIFDGYKKRVQRER